MEKQEQPQRGTKNAKETTRKVSEPNPRHLNYWLKARV
jgi:hypothetical protein